MMIDFAWLIPILPLIAFVIIALAPKKFLIREGGAPWIIGLSTASFVLSILVIIDILNGNTLTGAASPRVTWLEVGDYKLTFGIWVDQLTGIMLLIVSLVGTLVVIYSVGYMRAEGERKRRYYAEISLFIGVMFGLVLADNYLFMFIFWELVGLCSYLLIGFWKERPSAASAAKRAFIVTRVGDIMLMSGLILLLKSVGSLDFTTLFAQHSLTMDPGLATLAMVFLFGGAIGKSAQFPLHEWLPDAMEGPTTVSALIHAATMVNAGVYLVARSFPMLIQTPDALALIGIIGGITALIAATNALVATDIKRVLAYSTISQLGYMMLALGAGGLILVTLSEADVAEGYSAGMFHLMNHSFFKALLFLAAGSVIHGIGTQDMRNMGGLSKTMKITSLTMLIGSLSIAGIPPFSGFWSKDEVLSSAFNAAQAAPDYGTLFLILWLMGVITAFLTAFYMFRMWFMTFSGKPRTDSHSHESPRIMTYPLMILAVLAVVSGLIVLLSGGFLFEQVDPMQAMADIFMSPLTYAALGASLIGLFAAYFIYYKGSVSVARLSQGVSGKFQRLLANRYYISAAYDAFGLYIIYGMSLVADIFDRYVIDGVVNGISSVSKRAGALMRPAQTGLVQNYIMIIMGGAILLLLFLMLKGGI